LVEQTPFDVSVFRYFEDWQAKHLLSDFGAIPNYLPDRVERETDQQYLSSFMTHPTMSGLAFSLSLFANANRGGRSEYASLDVVGQDFLPNTGAKNANRNYFIRKIEYYFRKRFGSPLYDVITSLARVVLEDKTITKDIVRTVLRKTSSSSSSVGFRPMKQRKPTRYRLPKIV
jgi:hypothetical protein